MLLLLLVLVADVPLLVLVVAIVFIAVVVVAFQDVRVIENLAWLSRKLQHDSVKDEAGKRLSKGLD